MIKSLSKTGIKEMYFNIYGLHITSAQLIAHSTVKVRLFSSKIHSKNKTRMFTLTASIQYSIRGLNQSN